VAVKKTFRQVIKKKRGGDDVDGIHPYAKRLTERREKNRNSKITKLKIRFFLIQTNNE
jgi:hypothetical protein